MSSTSAMPSIEDGADQDAVLVMVVDDHPFYRSGVLSLFERLTGFDVVGEAKSGEDALEEAARTEPDIVILDIQLPGRDGIDTCRELTSSFPEVRVVILTQFASVELKRKAFKAGARGFVAKASDPGVLQAAVTTVLEDSVFVDPLVKSSKGLTARELEVLTHLAHGGNAVKIADSLGLSYATVQDRIANAKRKLEAPSRDAAIAEAARRGLV